MAKQEEDSSHAWEVWRQTAVSSREGIKGALFGRWHQSWVLMSGKILTGEKETAVFRLWVGTGLRAAGGKTAL